MARTDLHIKVVIEHEENEKPERIAAEVIRAVERLYPVRGASLSSAVPHADE